MSFTSKARGLCKWVVCLFLLCVSTGCETVRASKKSSPLSLLLEANGFKQKETTFTLISERDPPENRLLLTETKVIWNCIREAYPIASYKFADFYDLELKSKEGKIAHLYVRAHDSCALFFRDLPVEHPDFHNDDPHHYFVAPGLLYPIVAETLKSPEEAGKKKKGK